MSQQIPFFPLNLVAYPSESLSLHIFEPRYQQLIQDCQAKNINFGIPVYIDDTIGQFGTEVQITEIVNQYADGRMDIKTKGMRIFEVLDFQNPLGDKLYAGGEVSFLSTEDDANAAEKMLLAEKALELYELLQVNVEVSYHTPFLSYQIAHKLGLSVKQEYYLLQLDKETDRINYLLDHLTRTIPVLRETERTKNIIHMNGHFKNFDPLTF